jgi:hypothetical protein
MPLLRMGGYTIKAAVREGATANLPVSSLPGY